MEAELARRPAFPYGADYQRRPIGGPTVCQDAGRAWGRIHGAQHRGPAMPVHGPLTERWARPGNVPRWYVWWRLLGVQDGHCATCPGPAEVVDHDHVTGLLRGLLCYDCNTTEAAHARALERGQHRGEVCWFASYWAAPPAAPFGWFWPDPARSTTTFFLPAPPAWAPRRVPRRLCSPFMCRMRARGLLLGR
jgi:hypothetical protein